PGLGVHRHDPRLERVVELALLADGVEDRRAPLLQLAQVVQPLLQRPQLGVVQPAGRFLAVPGDERHRGAAIEQVDGRTDLPLGHAQLVGDPLGQHAVPPWQDGELPDEPYARAGLARPGTCDVRGTLRSAKEIQIRRGRFQMPGDPRRTRPVTRWHRTSSMSTPGRYPIAPARVQWTAAR